MNIEIRSLVSTDIPVASRIMNLAFGTPGSREGDLRKCLFLQPDGWRLAVCDGQPVGTVGAVDYGSFAWIGMMTVLPERQRQGIGELLMKNILDWLDGRACPLVRLDASQAGSGLYRKLGFVDTGLTNLFMDPKFEPIPDGSYKVTVMQPEDVAQVVSFDEATFGAQRERLLHFYSDEFQHRCFVVRAESGEFSGYLVAQSSRIGPWACTTPEAAEALLGIALSLPFDGPLRLISPSENVQAERMFNRLGFVQGPKHWHMLRVKSDYPSAGRDQNSLIKIIPGRRDLIYAQASFALG